MPICQASYDSSRSTVNDLPLSNSIRKRAGLANTYPGHLGVEKRQYRANAPLVSRVENDRGVTVAQMASRFDTDGRRSAWSARSRHSRKSSSIRPTRQSSVATNQPISVSLSCM